MPRVTAFVFTYGPDTAMTVAAARRLSQEGVDDIPLVEDETNPLDAALIPELRGVHVVTSNFNRKGNLNGKECVLGMLRLMQAQAELLGSDIVMKVDADTLVGPKFFRTLFTKLKEGYEAVQTTYQPHFAAGACHAFSALLLDDLVKMAKDLESDEDNLSAGKYPLPHPEDRTISSFIDTTGVKVYREPIIFYDHEFNGFRVVQDRIAVCFGCYMGLPSDRAKAKAMVAERMNLFKF